MLPVCFYAIDGQFVPRCSKFHKKCELARETPIPAMSRWPSATPVTCRCFRPRTREKGSRIRQPSPQPCFHTLIRNEAGGLKSALAMLEFTFDGHFCAAAGAAGGAPGGSERLLCRGRV